MRVIVSFAVALALAPVMAVAQERTPEQRQRIVDLAFVLGQSHALRQLCTGEGDQYWRARMIKLERTEEADGALVARLRESFNTGFAAAGAEHVSCTLAARMAIRRVTDRGQALAIPLSQVVQTPAQSDVAEPEGAR